MPLRRVIASTMLVLAFGTTAQANGLKPIQAQHLDLRGVSGTAYYTVEPDGFHLVTTLAQDGKDEPPIRVQTVLAVGQAVIFSVPGRVGIEPVTITFERQGDKVTVRGNLHGSLPGF